MAFEVELTNNHTGEDFSIVLNTASLDAAIELARIEFPDPYYTLTFIAEGN